MTKEKKELTPEQKAKIKESNLSNLKNENLKTIAAVSLIDSKNPMTGTNKYGELIRDMVWANMPEISQTDISNFGKNTNLLNYIENSKNFKEAGFQKGDKIPNQYLAEQAKISILGAINNTNIEDILSNVGIELNIKEEVKGKTLKELGEDQDYKQIAGFVKHLYKDKIQNKVISKSFAQSAKNVAGSLEKILEEIQESLPKTDTEKTDTEKTDKEQLEKEREIALLNLKADALIKTGIYGEIASNISLYGEAMENKTGEVASTLVNKLMYNVSSDEKISVEKMVRFRTKEQGYERGAISTKDLANACNSIKTQSIYSLKVSDIIEGMKEDIGKSKYDFLSDNVKNSYVGELIENGSDEIKEKVKQLVGTYNTYITQKETSKMIDLYDGSQESNKEYLENSNIAQPKEKSE